ncbi:MAG: hypothetical protein JXR76_10635 [Deltaproteobacteria bacterium]|nr:hypothetical protein [Deltaproteobacteria bacterium]
MIQSRNTNDSFRVFYDPQSAPMSPNSKRVSRLFVQRGLAEPWRVTIKPAEDGYFELKGMLDSYQSREIVLSMVRTHLSTWRLIDHLTIADDLAAAS